MDHRNDSCPSVAVLADDLTSAADGAAPFRRTGHRARILLRDDSSERDESAAGVTALDLAGRLLDVAEATARTRRAARTHAGSDLLLKTVDSTLRGNIAAEIRAAYEGSGRRAALIAPAFPAEGRTTVRGVQLVRGVAVHASEFGRDPVHPAHCSDLAELLPEAVLVDAGRADELPAAIDKGGLIVCSAATDGDLDRIVAAVDAVDDVLWIGSPGLAAALAARSARPEAMPVPELVPATRPLVVVGSANPAARRQLSNLHAELGSAGVTVATGDPGTSVAELSAADARILTLRTPDERHTPATANTLTQHLAEVTRTLVAAGTVDALVLTGGETAAHVLGQLDVAGIELTDEPEPGVARGVLLGSRNIPVLIKAGGFGDDDLLLRLCALAAGADRSQGEG
ncbi:four-carbon acid sugar kinase family protein [Streptomyces sp. NPDC058067]|uniref:four-carbon acid sugar kinase family protein n=1 Tax=Streptomyces sp. NPDC058067 TaxID=3346324 RepID=UPI0036E0C0B6